MTERRKAMKCRTGGSVVVGAVESKKKVKKKKAVKETETEKEKTDVN